MRRFLTILPLLVAACSASPAPPIERPARLTDREIVDLTHPFDVTTIFWPTSDRFVLTKGPEGVTEAGHFYNANTFATSEHGGTHLDAPYHFFQGRHKIGEIPIDRFVAQGVLLDVEDRCRRNRDYRVSISDFMKWEREFGRIPEGAIVLIRTGFGAYWPDAREYLGTSERGPEAVPLLSFPGLDPKSAEWLARQRSIKAVGIDTASIDPGKSTDFKSHVSLAEHNVLILENVANLDQLGEIGFEVIALPMKISEGSGAPLRIIALK